MPFVIKLKRPRPNPKWRIEELIKEATEAPAGTLARRDDPWEDEILRVFQGETDNVSSRVERFVLLWANPHKRAKIQAFLFAGADAQKIAEVFRIKNVEIVSLFAKYCFDVSVFHDVLDCEEFAEVCRKAGANGNNPEAQMLYEGYTYGLDYLLSHYGNDVSAEKAMQDMLRVEYAEFTKARHSRDSEASSRKAKAIDRFTKIMRSIPAAQALKEDRGDVFVQIENHVKQQRQEEMRRQIEDAAFDIVGID